jgi:hypothetical protein
VHPAALGHELDVGRRVIQHVNFQFLGPDVVTRRVELEHALISALTAVSTRCCAVRLPCSASLPVTMLSAMQRLPDVMAVHPTADCSPQLLWAHDVLLHLPFLFPRHAREMLRLHCMHVMGFTKASCASVCERRTTVHYGHFAHQRRLSYARVSGNAGFGQFTSVIIGVDFYMLQADYDKIRAVAAVPAEQYPFTAQSSYASVVVLEKLVQQKVSLASKRRERFPQTCPQHGAVGNDNSGALAERQRLALLMQLNSSNKVFPSERIYLESPAQRAEDDVVLPSSPAERLWASTLSQLQVMRLTDATCTTTPGRWQHVRHNV